MSKLKSIWLRLRIILIKFLAGPNPVVLNAEFDGGLVISNSNGAIVSNCRFLKYEGDHVILGERCVYNTELIVE